MTKDMRNEMPKSIRGKLDRRTGYCNCEETKDEYGGCVPNEKGTRCRACGFRIKKSIIKTENRPKSIRAVLEKYAYSEDSRNEHPNYTIDQALKDLSEIVLAMPRTPYDTEALQKVREATIEEISNIILGGLNDR